MYPSLFLLFIVEGGWCNSLRRHEGEETQERQRGRRESGGDICLSWEATLGLILQWLFRCTKIKENGFWFGSKHRALAGLCSVAASMV